MKKIRIVYIVSQPVRWMAFEWIARELDPGRFDLSFILVNEEEPPLAKFLASKGVPYLYVQCSGRRDRPRAIARVVRYCRQERVDIVHCHFREACIAGLLGALLAGVKVRLYTRHHAGPFPPGQPVGRYRDRLFNRLSTRIIAPSRVVRDVLVDREGVSSSKVTLLSHGFDLEAFARPSLESVRVLKEKYRIASEGPTIGVVARYIESKGVQFIVPAFRRLLVDYPNAVLVLANARGYYRSVIHDELAAVPSDRWLEIPFEEDICSLYKLFDVFVHAPVSEAAEGFGQVYVEALASGVPSVFTLAGTARDFIEHGRNALVVEHGNSEQMYQSIKRILEDESLRDSLVEHGLASVQESFSLDGMMTNLESCYFDSVRESGGSTEWLVSEKAAKH